MSQDYLIKQGSSNLSDLFQNSSLGVVGFGVKYGGTTYLPQAKFHIVDDLLSRPIFQVDAKNGSSVYSIKTFYPYGGRTYGIFQTGPTDGTGYNFFQNPIGIGCYPLDGYGLLATGSGSFTGGLFLGESYEGPPPTFIHSRSPNFKITLEPPSVKNKSFGAKDCIIINNSGLESSVTISDYLNVMGRTSTTTFSMGQNAGLNKVMICSDDFGNATWTNVSGFITDYWLTKKNNVYLNHQKYNNLGVGTEEPSDKLQVNDGVVRLVIGDASGETFHYGTSYLGFNASRDKRNLKWTVLCDGVHNGGTVLNGDVGGNMFFINVPSEASCTSSQSFTDDEMINMTRMTITNKGDVGIGTRNPGVALDVERNNETKIRSFSLGSYKSSVWAMNYNGGYGLSVDENGIGSLNENAWNPNPIMTFHNGRIGIGCSNFDQYNTDHKLFVQGGITTEDINIALQGNWPDNVFSDDYKLTPITELENFINSNRHLPDIPTESDIKGNGINLGEMNVLLLKKVEELTLYVIEQQKEINTLKEELNKLK